jgi:hypothetical protein
MDFQYGRSLREVGPENSMDEVTVSFSAGACRVVEQIKEVTWAEGLFYGTDQRGEMAF